MHSFLRALIFLAGFSVMCFSAVAQQQDKEQSKLYMEQAELVMADTKAMDDARDIMVIAADYDTTNIKANFEAGHMFLLTINKDRATKYFLRIYRQNPGFRFDLEYWIGQGYQLGLDFNNASRFYTQYRNKVVKDPEHRGGDVVSIVEVNRRLVECQNGKEFVAHPQNYSIVNLGAQVNSEYEDYGPVLSDKEDEIVFTTRRRDNNTYENVADDNKPYEDIFITKKSGDTWTRARPIGPNINQKFNDSNLALSPDGNTLFVYKDPGDIYYSDRQKDGTWGTPQPLPGLINSSFKESSLSITRDGKRLYFASDRPGGLGGSDIYVCTKDSKGEWTRIKNLGPVINSDQDEDGPFIDHNEKILYYSSKGKKSMGGFDIFKSTLVDAEKNEWSAPENLGYPINTPDNDVYYVASNDGLRGYYSSVRDDGLGYSDIYSITISDKPAKKPDSTKVVVQPLKYVVTVVDATDQSPLEAKVRLQGAKDNVMVGVDDKGKGVYEFTISDEAAKQYRLSVELEGYVFVNQVVSLEGASVAAKTVTKTVSMRKLEVGVTSVLRNIYFDFDRATFKKESYSELNKLEEMMKQNASIKVEIAGHTDYIGTKEFNVQLSLRRANAVRSFLTSKGIDPRRVTTVGYGKSKPLASNDDEKDGRELNRRVEFKVLSN